jgi:indole-3-acetate monooxygenase
MHQAIRESDPEAVGSAESAELLAAVAALRPTIREHQAEIEQERRIPPRLVERLRAAGLYRMLVPRALGGLQVHPRTYFRAVELAAEGDGSVGWNVANSGVASLAALSLPDEGVRELFDGGPDTIFAGTLVPGGGRGVRVPGGYRVSGRWPFGSGCRESQWMVSNFVVADDDGQASRPAEARRAFFRPDACVVVDTWDVGGLRGTGSHDWTVTDVFVPEHLTVRFDGGPARNQWQRWPGTLYALSVHAVIGFHHSSVATGIARAGIDELVELAGRKVPRARPGLLRERPHVQESVGRAEALLGAAQAYRARVTDELWDKVEAGGAATLEDVARCRLAATHVADGALQAMDLMYRAGGTTSIQRSHRLARCWRDIHTVGQTATISPEWYALGGQALLGLDPGPRLAPT